MISIIVPIYNIEKYLPQCIESIIGQTYNDLDIILVDDGSTDASSIICDEYAKKDSRIRVIHKKNEGLVRARKTGIQAAYGEYIAYVDGDDWIEPDMMENLLSKMIEQDVDLVMCGRYEDTGDVSKELHQDFPEGRYDKGALIKEIYPRMIVGEKFFDWKISPGVWDKLYKKEIIKPFQMQVNDGLRMGEDAACVYPMLLNVDSIYILNRCLYHYRQTSNSMVKDIKTYDKERVQFALLYQTVDKCFEKYKNIYDLREQWLKYVIFLMIPRSDGLYDKYEQLDYLFPFSEVKRGSNIILYGAGTYGQRLYKYIVKTGFCRIATWVDRNYVELQKLGLDVKSPDVISNVDSNIIVIANTYAKSRNGLYEVLVKKYPDYKICMIDEKLLFSDMAKRALGLTK